MKKFYYLSFVVLCLVVFSSCTNEDDLETNQTTADDEGRKGKVAAEVFNQEVTALAEEEEEEGRKGKVAAKGSNSKVTNSTDEEEGRKGKVAASAE